MSSGLYRQSGCWWLRQVLCPRFLQGTLILFLSFFSPSAWPAQGPEEQTMVTKEKEKSDILLIPMGETRPEILEQLALNIKKSIGKTPRVGNALMIPEEAFNRKRRQYDSAVILDRLREVPSEGGSLKLAVADVDLFANGLNFVFGQAELGGSCAVISLVRLRPAFYGEEPDEQLFALRVLKEAVHEIGHVWSLEHCPRKTCVMRFSNSLRDTDVKSERFCENCAKKLEREGHLPKEGS